MGSNRFFVLAGAFAAMLLLVVRSFWVGDSGLPVTVVLGAALVLGIAGAARAELRVRNGQDPWK